ncbi:hypothetical protein Vadar_013001 [Vaccinium darrowii]|uniref:Uncharacterized protein n=1 Tax=Vaccinium darrowii TaxID=229202 RepID=A0ACB7ZJ95_9ERIC|nr:hypothetical protein Vadar_013001 [Vaccinium darrowii]
MSGAGKVVCVTGASGYIASWIVKLLLDRGYTVKATVRSLSDPTKTDHLLSLHGAKERLQLFEANLMEEGSFDSVVDGCEGVFHTASPCVLEVSNPQEELIKPAVKGTQNVLCSCVKVPSIKRVVVTSSIASVAFNNRPKNPDVVIDETWFSDPVYCEQSKLFYHLSKTLAEDAAWKLSRVNGIDLVTINPGFVIGPLLQPTLNLTSEALLNLIKNDTIAFLGDLFALYNILGNGAGAKQKCFRGYAVDTLSPLLNEAGLNSVSYIRVPMSVMPSLEARNLLDAGTSLFSDGVYWYVDVRDVALAHIQAFEVSSASGRYCLVGKVTNTTEALNILRKLYPALNLPERANSIMLTDRGERVFANSGALAMFKALCLPLVGLGNFFAVDVFVRPLLIGVVAITSSFSFVVVSKLAGPCSSSSAYSTDNPTTTLVVQLRDILCRDLVHMVCSYYRLPQDLAEVKKLDI